MSPRRAWWHLGSEDRSLNLEKRSELMELVLMDAPRRLVREVLRKMDEDLDETERYEDRERRSLGGWGGVGMGEMMGGRFI